MVHCATTVYCLFHFVAVVVIVPVPITFSLSRITYSHLHEHTYETEAVNLTRTHACVCLWVYSWLLCSIALRGNCLCECECVYDDVVVWFANTTYLAVYLFCVVMLTFFSPCIIPRFFVSTVRHCCLARTYTRQRAIIVSSYLCLSVSLLFRGNNNSLKWHMHIERHTYSLTHSQLTFLPFPNTHTTKKFSV